MKTSRICIGILGTTILLAVVAGCEQKVKSPNLPRPTGEPYEVSHGTDPNGQEIRLSNFDGKSWTEYRIAEGKREKFHHRADKPIHTSRSAHQGPLRAIFTSNSETAYIELVAGEEHDSPLIVECCHVYNVADVLDANQTHLYEIVWSPSGLQMALLINDIPHVVFDVQQARCWSRTGFPNKSNGYWEFRGRTWDDRAPAVFR